MIASAARSASVSAAVLLVLAVGPAPVGAKARTEPGVIVVRNDSGLDLRRVSFSEHARDAARALRVGSVAPVPRGATQRVERPTGAPPLPRKVEIRWTDAEGNEFGEVVDLKPIFSAAGDVLVVRIGPSHELQVYREPSP